MGDTEYYDTLNLSKDCDQSKIKSAYRKMALKYHPDKNPSPEAAEMFKKVGAAYEVLSDPEKRKIYDTRGKAGLEGPGGGPGGPGGPGGMGGFSAEDIFSSFFGGGARRGGGGASQVRKPRDLLVELRISLEEFYCGCTKEINIKRRRKCPGCDGTRSASKKVVPCNACGGKGQRVYIRQMGGMQMQQVGPCDRCQGKKTIPQGRKCDNCNAEGFLHVRSKLKVHVRKGMGDGEVLRLDGEGDQIEGYDVSGDIMIILNEEAHPYFARRGDHLWVKECQVTLNHLFAKLPIPVEHLDGRIILCTPPLGEVVMNPSQYVYSVYREGFPISGTDGNEKGNLYLDLKVVMPKVLSEEQRKMIAAALDWKAPEQDATAVSSSRGNKATTAGGSPTITKKVAVTLVPWDDGWLGAKKETSAMGEEKAQGKKGKKAAQKNSGGGNGGPGGMPRAGPGGMPQGVHVQQCPQQ